jgi:DNA-binding NtrC family response regulator
MSGLDLLKEVKRLSPETDVIVMTGYSSAESAIEALNLGATAYLEKPFDQVRSVVAKIEEVVAQQRERVRKRHQLHLIKTRNKTFLDQYRLIRADLEAWLQARGVSRRWF